MTWAFHFAVVARYLALFRDQRAYGIPAFLENPPVFARYPLFELAIRSHALISALA